MKKKPVGAVEGKIRSGSLIVKIPIEQPRTSRSGKTKVVASTHGFRRIGVRLNGRELYMTANAAFYE